MEKILIFSENLAAYPELCTGAKMFGKAVAAFVIGNADDAKEITKYGTDKVYYTLPGDILENYYATLKSIVDKESFNAVLIGTTKAGRVIAGRLAAALKTTALTDLTDISSDGSSISGNQLYYGGAAVISVKSRGCAVVTVSAGVFEPAVKDESRTGEIAEADRAPSDSRIKLLEVRAKESETVDLTVAKKVVGIGRGIAKNSDIDMMKEFAALIGGEVGCTRPIAEGEGWMSADRYIGVSGVMLKPDLYVSAGVSGQVQHTIGIKGAKIIVAVNKDKNAPIFKECDYGIVGDLYKVIPALAALIKG